MATQTTTTHQRVEDLVAQIRKQLREVGGAARPVRGIIGRVTVSQAGHAYFDLRDECTSARVNCVVFAGRAAPTAGPAVVTVDRLDFYAPGAACQVVVRTCESLGDAEPANGVALARLSRAGLLDRSRLAVPDFVSHVCLVTSRGSAAAHDMRQSIAERWAGLRTTLIHASVQGSDAPLQLVRALDAARALSPPPDVIVCGRGGGAETDLAAFDDERVARALARGAIPTISAVGHETDHTLADALADLRAKTPTAAIELAIPVSRDARYAELGAQRAALATAVRRVVQRLQGAQAAARTSLECATRHALTAATHAVTTRRVALCAQTERRVARACAALAARRTAARTAALRRLDRCAAEVGRARARLATSADSRLAGAQAHLAAQREALNARALPTAWARGFVVLADARNRRVRRLDTLAEGDRLCIRAADQIVHVVVAKRQRPE